MTPPQNLLPGYTFQDLELLRQALRHCSMGSKNNERLEFLGDAILGMVIAETVYNRFPESPPGALTRLRSQLVCRDSVAGVARDMDLGRHVKLGPGEQKTGAWQRPKVLEDTLEALIGAAYLDGSFVTCRDVIRSLFKPLLEAMTDPGGKDSKTRLQEYLHTRGTTLPEYRLVREWGPDHARRFEVACKVPGVEQPFTAVGRSRKAAEQASASRALAHWQSP